MKALILNSGTGSRLGEITKSHPKCMTIISDGETILSRQLKMLAFVGIKDVVITTGPFEDALKEHCYALGLPLNITFVNNPKYKETNYIYSIFLAADVLEDDILLMHGDLVFSKNVLEQVHNSTNSCMTVSSTLPLPEKDFKAVIINKPYIQKVGIEFFENALSAQPLYKLLKADWMVWLNQIKLFCEESNVNCYAENALNEVSDKCLISTLDVKDSLCNEIDTINDLENIKQRLKMEW